MVLVIYTSATVKGKGEKFNAFMKESLKNYMRMGLPCTAMTMIEWCAYSLMTFQSGLLGVNTQACQVILLSIGSMMFMVSVGLAQAASALIGK